jgi:aminopeptidase N
LVDYTSPKFESSVRQNAIINALLINSKESLVLQSLINATTHHKWQFVKFAKDKIRELLTQEGYRDLFVASLPTLTNTEKNTLQKLLDEKK